MLKLALNVWGNTTAPLADSSRVVAKRWISKLRMKELIKNIQNITWQSVEKVSGIVADFATEQIGRLPLFASSEISDQYGNTRYDEKHYFLIPYRLSEIKYTFYSMRVLPYGVPPINDLPKKRVFHFPNAHCDSLVEHVLVNQIREQYKEISRPSNTTFGDSLIDIANEIDKVEGKLTNGLLLIGGLVAFINPLAGAGLALIPGLSSRLSKYGLKNVGEKLNQTELKQEIQKAEQTVLKEFREATTVSIVNPILAELETALDTTEQEHDPIKEFQFDRYLFSDADNSRYIEISCTAVTNTYREVIHRQKLWEKASLGPEDIRWLKSMEDVAEQKRVANQRLSKWKDKLIMLEQRLAETQNNVGSEILQNIESKLTHILGNYGKKKEFDINTYEIDKIANEYIPEMINQYLKLPASHVRTRILSNGKTAEATINEQLTLLDEALGRIQESLLDEDSRLLSIHGRFLKDKFVDQAFRLGK